MNNGQYDTLYFKYKYSLSVIDFRQFLVFIIMFDAQLSVSLRPCVKILHQKLFHIYIFRRMRSIWRRHIEGDWKNKNVPVQFVQLFFFTPSLITKCTRIVCLIRKTIFVKLIYITASIDLTKHFMKHIGMPPYINFQNFFKSMIFINKHLSKYSTTFGLFSFIRQDF